ncbi:amidohydrolase [Fulvivirga sedimenti]|uniref:Amidohydrolase n=1 Tax=Fulvivirga sedimenti TaxID=2879465 RepID=A0A9X1HMR9_9BACT|nr:amidohydrolase [Fulvivirga sedimenti]MCA6073688.1 amidohydrolase [Fulvivirga sedimenti]
MKKYFYFFLAFILTSAAMAQNKKLYERVSAEADRVDPKVIEWRRDIHQNAELSNREFRTAEKVAEHLRSLGIEVQTGVAHTGVIGILKGDKPGPTVALRADMDGLPVVERVDIPFKSVQKSEYEGQEVGVMHACGHDTHVAILMGVAEILAGMKKDIPGTVKFIFQPAEEGAPAGEEGGAELMIKEGVMQGVSAIFGLHINSQTEVGKLTYKPGGAMASSNRYTIKVKGEQVHGAYPWEGTDPIVTAAQIINGLQTIVSRKMELVNEAAVVSVGSIHGGVRNNIIPEEVMLDGTFRSLDEDMRLIIEEQIRLKATKIAESMGATAEVTIYPGNPVTYNDPELTARMLPALEWAAGKENVELRKAVTGAEDFALFAKEAPGLYFWLGGMPEGVAVEDAAPHHTPDFYVDDSRLEVGVKALSMLALNYLYSAD